MVWITAAVASLLLVQVYGAPSSIARGLLHANRPSLERRMEKAAYNLVEERQTTSPTINMTQWDIDTVAACTATLSMLSTASNPSGMAVCYNLVQLDTNQGAFVADLRLFEVSPPSGAWSGIPLQQMQGGVQFHGATASQINGQKVVSRDMTRQHLSKRLSEGPILHRTYMIVGRINADQMIPPMTMYELRFLLLMTISLTSPLDRR